MKKIIVANWKINPSTEKEAVELFDAVQNGAKNIKNVEIIICPPFVYISVLAHLTSETLSIGGQNVFYKEEGAFTGEISPIQLRDLGVKYVMVGHSEARKHLNETDEIVNKKIKECLAEGLKPILCVGEDIGEDKEEVLNRQLKSALKDVPCSMFHVSCVIAYEPVWAIGTGKNCSIEETKSSVALVRKVIAELYNQEASEAVKILYGGSVSRENSADYVKSDGVQGLLVGGASLDAENFIKIVKSAESISRVN